MRTFTIAAVVLLIIAGAIYGEAVVWQECLSDHSWFYCSRVLSK